MAKYTNIGYETANQEDDTPENYLERQRLSARDKARAAKDQFKEDFRTSSGLPGSKGEGSLQTVTSDQWQRERARAAEEVKRLERRARQKGATAEFAENVSDFRDYIGSSVYNPQDVAAAGGLDPRIMQMMQQSRGVANNANVNALRQGFGQDQQRALDARNQMMAAVNMYNPYATGEQSISRDQAGIDMERARAATLSNLAGQGRGLGAAGFMAAQRGISDQNAAISQQAQQNAAREQLAAIGAMQQGLGVVAGLDASQQGLALQGMGQEANMLAQGENQAAQLMQLALQEQGRQAQFDYAKEQGKQARDMALVNAGMGQYGQERAIDMAKMADQAAQQQRQNDGILKAISSFVPFGG